MLLINNFHGVRSVIRYGNPHGRQRARGWEGALYSNNIFMYNSIIIFILKYLYVFIIVFKTYFTIEINLKIQTKLFLCSIQPQFLVPRPSPVLTAAWRGTWRDFFAAARGSVHKLRVIILFACFI